MRAEDLSVWVTDATGAAVGVIDADFLPGAVFAPRINDVGTWSITLPDTVDGAPYPLAEALAKPGSGILVFVPTSSTTPTLISGPTDGRSLVRDDEHPQGVWTFTGVSDETILDGPLAYPDPSSADPRAQATTAWKKTGTVESLIRQVVAFNVANGLLRIPTTNWAPAGRLLGARQRFTLADVSQNRGTTKTLTLRYENILDVVQGLVADQALIFRVVRGHWSPTVEASSRTMMLVISESQLLDASHLVDLVAETAQAEQATQGNRSVHRVIAAGDEEGPGTVAVADATVAAGEYPRESFISTTGAEAEVQEAALVELEAGAQVSSWTATPREDLADDPLAWLGNTVPVAMSSDRSVIDHARVNQVIVSVDAERVHTQIVLGNPDGSDWESQALARIDSLAGRVSALEKNNNLPYARTQIDNAQETADKAQEAADAAQASAVDAAIAAGNAQVTADGLNYIFYQEAPPSDEDVPGDGVLKARDTWFDTSDGNRMHRFDGETWVDVALGAAALDQAIVFQIDAAMSTAQGAQDELDTFSTWFRIDEAGAHMGRTDSPFQTHVLPERFAITENGQTTTYWESGRMVVPSAVVDELVFANHKIEQYGTGSVVRSI